MSTFANRLKILRKNKKISQDEISKILKISRKQISQYENDKDLPNVFSIMKLADYFNVTLDYILGISSENDAEKFWIQKQKNKRLQFVKQPTGQFEYQYRINGAVKKSIFKYIFGVFSKNADKQGLEEINKIRKTKNIPLSTEPVSTYRFFILEEITGEYFPEMFKSDSNMEFLALIAYINETLGLAYQIEPTSDGNRLVNFLVKGKQVPSIVDYQNNLPDNNDLDIPRVKKALEAHQFYVEVSTRYGQKIFIHELDMKRLVLALDYTGFSEKQKKDILAGCVDELLY